VGEHITFVGLDMHKATIAVCVAEAGHAGEARFIGEIPNEPDALDKLAARLSRGGWTLRFVHEAGPCGHGVHRPSATGATTASSRRTGSGRLHERRAGG
jgi:hypothetical protein